MTAVQLPHPAPAGAGPTEVPVAESPPLERAVMVQRWSNLVFLHWRYPVDDVAALLPAGLEPDTFDASAWVGLIPFNMEGLGFPGLAPLPHVGAFPEVNVRTYVRAKGRRGVWFFSLDVDRLLPALTARVGYRLPYCSGHAQHEWTDLGFASEVSRRWPRTSAPATTSLRTRRLATPVDTPLSHFLTDRWRLFSSGRGGTLREARVDHPPWQLHAAEATAIDDTLVVAAGLPAPRGEPHAMWSPGVDVRIGRPRRVRRP